MYSLAWTGFLERKALQGCSAVQDLGFRFQGVRACGIRVRVQC